MEDIDKDGGVAKRKKDAFHHEKAVQEVLGRASMVMGGACTVSGRGWRYKVSEQHNVTTENEPTFVLSRTK